MIQLDGVSIPTLDRDFLDLQAYDHQAASEDLLRSGGPFFAINESPTGSGKTLSWLKPALDERIDTVAIFPTNALVADQASTVRSVAHEHYEDQVGIVAATGDTIAEWRSEYGVRSKGEALTKRVEESLVRNRTTILLTNPDTLVLVRKGMYHHQFVSSKFDRFEMVVLDEFHLADVKQRDTLLFLIDEMHELPDRQSRTNRFYFLSATPENDDNHGRTLTTRLSEDLDVGVERISANRRPSSDVQNMEDWRAVMPAVEVYLRESQTFRTSERLLAADVVDEFVQFCASEQTLVMLDGVHEVDQVYETLDRRLDSTVRRLTGFHKGDVATKISDFDVLVSNSAVEVGLDVQPDRLVFSAHDAPTLVQRLGRLRAKEGDSLHSVWCFVPEPVRAQIESMLDHKPDPDRITRSDFEEAVDQAFTDECDLSSFSRRWGELEAFQHVMERVEDVPSDAVRDSVMDRGLDRIKRHYYYPHGRGFDADDLERLHSWTDYDLIDELKSYRGSGLQIMVKDRDDDGSSMKLYDLFYLLRWGQLEFHPPDGFRSLLSGKESRFYDAYSDYAVGFCVFDGKVPIDDGGDSYAGRSVSLHAESSVLHRMKTESDVQRKPEMVDGLAVHIDDRDAPPINGIGHLRDEMTDAERLCYVVPGHSSTVKASYGLGDFFFLYQLGKDSVAIGLEALYLHCLVQDRIEAEDRDWGLDG